MPGASGEWKKALSDARRRARLGRAAWKSERAKAWPLHPQSHCKRSEGETTGAGDNTTAQATRQRPDSRRQIGEALNLLAVSPVFLSPLCRRIPRANWPGHDRFAAAPIDELSIAAMP